MRAMRVVRDAWDLQLLGASKIKGESSEHDIFTITALSNQFVSDPDFGMQPPQFLLFQSPDGINWSRSTLNFGEGRLREGVISGNASILVLHSNTTMNAGTGFLYSTNGGASWQEGPYIRYFNMDWFIKPSGEIVFAAMILTKKGCFALDLFDWYGNALNSGGASIPPWTGDTDKIEALYTKDMKPFLFSQLPE